MHIGVKIIWSFFVCIGIAVPISIHDLFKNSWHGTLMWLLEMVVFHLFLALIYWVIYKSVKKQHASGKFKDAGDLSTASRLLGPLITYIVGIVIGVVMVITGVV
jgi:hypothetical protein